MHIVQLLASLNLGGSEFVATELTEYLAGMGHRVTVIAADGPLGARVRNCGAEQLNWPLDRKRLPTLRYTAELAGWLRRERPDVLHLHSRFPAWICWLALQRLGRAQRPPLVTSMHGHYSVNPYSAIMARGAKTIAVSDYIRAYTLRNYPRVRPEQVVTIHNGASREQFPHGYRAPAAWRAAVEREFPDLAGKRWLLLPGRVSRRKGLADFLRLLAALLADYPDLHGVLVGDARPESRYPAELATLARTLGVSGSYTLTGGRANMRDWMASSEIVLSLTGHPPEAFGRTVLEALFLGRPLLGWNHGGPAEILAALFPEGAVEPGNVAELELRCRQFLDSPPQVKPGNAFTLENSMRRHLDLYEELLLA